MRSEQFRVQLQLECNLVVMTPLHTKHMVGRNRITTLASKCYKSQLPKHCSVPGQQRSLVQLKHVALPIHIYLCSSPHLEGILSEIWGEQSLQKALFPSVPNKEPINSGWRADTGHIQWKLNTHLSKQQYFGYRAELRALCQGAEVGSL